jgi:putative transposase
MDGRGRAIDNAFIERLWRSVKYEEVYLKDYANGWDAEASLAAYLQLGLGALQYVVVWIS